jgi:hypothetical protein
VNYAMIGGTVLEEVPEDVSRLGEEATELVAEARAEAIETLRELHRNDGRLQYGGAVEVAPDDVRLKPEYWLGRLEGAVLGLVVAMDLATEVE